MKTMIAHIAVDLAVKGHFDYLVADKDRGRIRTGDRVKVFFNRRIHTGYVVGFSESSSVDRLNTIISVLDSSPALDAVSLKLAGCMSGFYGCSMGKAIELQLPRQLRKPVPASFQEMNREGNVLPGKSRLWQDPAMRDSQEELLQEIIKKIRNGQSVIVCSPEAVSVEALAEKWRNRISGARIEVLAAKRKPREELEQWRRLREERPTVLIGTRSAVFAPLSPLGLIVVYDEAHASHKEEQSPYQRVHHVARWRSHLEGADVLFVAGVASLETLYEIRRDGGETKTFPVPSLAPLRFIDLSNFLPRRPFISMPLRNAIEEQLNQKQRVGLYLNRKEQVFHSVDEKGLSVERKVFGIEQIEERLNRWFPGRTIRLCERSTTRIPKSAEIVVGTRALFRMRYDLTFGLIGVINVDSELNRFDFRAAQETFTVLLHLRQIATRELVVQTMMPENYCLEAAARADFDAFYENELAFREQLEFPPFHCMMVIHIRTKTQKEFDSLRARLVGRLEKAAGGRGFLMETPGEGQSGPKGDVTGRLILKGQNHAPMLEWAQSVLRTVRAGRGGRVTLELDYAPVTLPSNTTDPTETDPL